MTEYSKLPDYMRDGARRYVQHGNKPGAFLTAVLSNDFMKAFMCADYVNTAAIRDWAIWLHNDAPCACYGSPARVAAWIAKGGEHGKAAACKKRCRRAER